MSGLKPNAILADHQRVTPSTLSRSVRSRALAVLLVAGITVTSSLPMAHAASAAAALTAGSAEADFLVRLNAERTNRGLQPLAGDAPLANTSRTWSADMRARNQLSHDPNLAAIAAAVEPAWRSVGENVGVGYTVLQLHDAFMASSGHRANILKPNYNRVGIGVVMSGSTIWITVRFLEGPAIVSTPPPPSRGGPVAGDFNGDGIEDVLVYGPGAASDQLLLGGPNQTFTRRTVSIGGYYYPVAGDFDADGRDEILWYGKGTLHDAIWRWNGTGFSSFVYTANGTYVPYGGDFDGDGHDDVLWFGPGSLTDRIGYGSASIGVFDTRVLASIGGNYRIATGDLDADGRSDAVLHQPGTASDALAYGSQRGVLPRVTIRVDGEYQPVIGDLDGNGADDVIWYGVGTRSDARWQMTGVRGQFTRVSVSVSGVYVPAAGDFNGDRRDDVLWFTPTSAVGDTVWWTQSTGAAVGQALQAS